MAIKTTYTCDRCDYSQDNHYQMWTVGAGITSNTNFSVPDWTHKKMWCRACCEEFHLLPIPASGTVAVVPPEPPTFEALLRELIADEIAARTGAR